MKLPIAIITVTFNAKPQLMETVQSLSKHRDKIDQFIVVDGASSDGTRELLENEGMITSWLSEPDSGIYEAMNKGWSLASNSNSILYLGAGDRLLSLPDDREFDSNAVIYGDVLLEDTGVFVGRADWKLRLGNTLHHQALLVPKQLNLPPPFNCRYPTYADYDFNLRLLKKGVLFKKSASLLSYATAGGISHDLNEVEMSQVVSDNFGPFAKFTSRAYMKIRKLRSSALVNARS